MKYRQVSGKERALFLNYTGRLERLDRGEYRYKLTWKAGNGDWSRGMTEWTTAGVMAVRLPQFYFSELECPPDVMFELCATDPSCEFEEIRDEN